MVPFKTDKGLRCLQASGELPLRDRHVLILADGRRAAREIAEALGGDAATRIERLLASGHLATQAPPRAPRAATAPEVDPPHAPGVAAARPAPKRSLAAARMYLLDMLGLQRGWEAAELARALQRTTEPTYQVPALLDALRYLRATTKPSVGQRVGEQLLALVPEAFVAQVREVLDDPVQALRSA